MDSQIIGAIITGSATIVAAVIGGWFAVKIKDMELKAREARTGEILTRAEKKAAHWMWGLIGAVLGAAVVFIIVLIVGNISFTIPIFSSPDSSAKSHTTEVIVHAEKQQNPTGLSVDQGDTIVIEDINGEWTGDENQAGFARGCGENFSDPVSDHVWPLPPDQYGGALIGYINDQPFFIGCNPGTITAPDSGFLNLGMNDCQGCFWDNDGALTVRLSVNP